MKHLMKLGVAGTILFSTLIANAEHDHKLVRSTTDKLLHGMDESHRARVAETASSVALDVKPLWETDVDGTKTARFLTVFTARESVGIETAWGDGGEAWGATQIHWRLWGPLLEEWSTIGSVYDLFDLETSMRSTVAIMHYLKGVCGSMKRAAYAYASGNCFGTIIGRSKIEARCALIGGC